RRGAHHADANVKLGESSTDCQLLKQRQSNSRAARIWSGNPKQSVHPISLARHAQSHSNENRRGPSTHSTSTMPLRSEHPESAVTRMDTISSSRSASSSCV